MLNIHLQYLQHLKLRLYICDIESPNRFPLGRICIFAVVQFFMNPLS